MNPFNRSHARQSASALAIARKSRRFHRPVNDAGAYLSTSSYFGANTFSFDLLSATLPEKEIAKLKEFATRDEQLTFELADKVAKAVKDWAIKKGATHYCHWFHPQTGATAEKHDAFFSFDGKGRPIEIFSGKQLVQSEPDASSFPSGGRRSTFEARGYTAWDASSPMFLMETDNGLTLCIPSLFVSYTGEALDKKTPLLRSLHALNHAALDAMKLLGQSDIKYVTATAGPEQEYFVIDEAFYNLRPDLALANRTLLGRVPPKGQQLEDHYFGSIKPRILNFMSECEYELYKLGVPCKTRHNEVAPSQCEMAPIFEHANIAADHNQLVMEVIRSVARRHNLVSLFHEKPYFGMNGSGKHVNWSMSDSKGNNLLEPGENPHENIRFLYFLVATIKAIHDYGDIMRCSVASAGNDFRLGANEAPPAIMSVYLGETLTEVLERLGSQAEMTKRDRTINLDLAKVPVIARDNTDRNRTSPFAFTGNKFEFRAVGASASISPPLTYLNTAVAQALTDLNERLRAKTGGKIASDEQLLSLITEVVIETKKVCFEGNNYAEEWHKEAERRGLPILRDTPAALDVLKTPKAKTLFSKAKIFTEDELNARHVVLVERYIKVRLIELETLQELVASHVLPAVDAQTASIAMTLNALKENGQSELTELKKSLVKLCAVGEKLRSGNDRLGKFIGDCQRDHDLKVAAKIGNDGMKLMNELRESANEAELLVDDQFWSLPKLREMVIFS